MILNKNNQIKNLTQTQLAYISGFLEGDGCILAQIVKGPYKYKFTIRLSITFYQKSSKHWFFLKLKKLIGVGNITIKKDGVVHYTILGLNLIDKFLQLLFPYLILKKSLIILIFQIIKDLRIVKTEADFIEVCKLVDKVADYNYSKNRRITSLIVQNVLMLPVETKILNPI